MGGRGAASPANTAAGTRRGDTFRFVYGSFLSATKRSGPSCPPRPRAAERTEARRPPNRGSERAETGGHGEGGGDSGDHTELAAAAPVEAPLRRRRVWRCLEDSRRFEDSNSGWGRLHQQALSGRLRAAPSRSTALSITRSSHQAYANGWLRLAISQERTAGRVCYASLLLLIMIAALLIATSWIVSRRPSPIPLPNAQCPAHYAVVGVRGGPRVRQPARRYATTCWAPPLLSGARYPSFTTRARWSSSLL